MSAAIRAAEARHRTYALLGRLALRGLDADSREIVAALPELDRAVEGEDPEAWAVAHQRVWGFSVHPFASVYLTEDGLMTGDEDHLGRQLLHLAWLCAAERDARVDGQEAAAARMLGVQRDFLAGQVLPWLPAVLATLDAEGTRFDRALAELVAELVVDHAEALGATVSTEGASPLEPGLLDDPRTNVKRIAEALLRPAVTGWALSPGAIGRLAAAAGVPEGFGPRAKKLEGVVFAAVDHGALPALVEALQVELEHWRMRYLGLEALGLPVSAWLGRVDATAAVLGRVRAAAA